MPPVLLTKRIEFAAAHRYLRSEWDEARNRAVFGPCYNAPAHGHNYLLEVTVSGDVDARSGMVINLFDLKRVLLEVIEEFDHMNLNLDMPYFRERIPTSENLARVLWMKLELQKDIGTLHAIRLHEDEDLYAEMTAAGYPDVASVTRRYSFTTALRDGLPSRDWDCFVTVRGRIDSVTGMVTDIGALNRLVQDRLLTRLEGGDMRAVFGAAPPSGAALARQVWELLAPDLVSGRLVHIRLVESRDLAFDYAP